MDSTRRDSKRDDSQLDPSNKLSAQLESELRKLEEAFTVDRQKLQEISARFEEELTQGLSDQSRCLIPSLEEDGSSIPMNVTWVLGWPSGHERGEYLTLDLGGTKLRVCWITLSESQGDTKLVQNIYILPEELKTGEAEPFWSFIADALQAFIEEHELGGSAKEPLHLAFTFSYPATQDYIDHGVLQTWTKGFDTKGVEGHDVAGQLRKAIAERDLPIKLVALINDTVGAMIASAYNDPETICGAIFGTGCNAAYMEDCGSIPKLGGLPEELPMAINCEYGAFDNSLQVLPRTKYDEMIDKESPRPGEQTFEKMSAGLYLGEIFRQVLLDLHHQGLALKHQDVSKLRQPYVLDTGFISDIEDDSSPKLSNTLASFKKTLDLSPSPAELLLSHRLAEMVATRAARLCSCGISAICRKKNITSGHVAADGSVANKHPQFKRRWAAAMGEVLDWPADREEDPIVITSAEDGSGIGAAVISAMTLERIQEGNLTGIKQI